MSYFRSVLFVPGNRPDRFDKALAAGADLVCIDLEDAVAPQNKVEARKRVLEFLSKTKANNISCRINALDKPWAQDDVEAIKSVVENLPFLMIPKVANRLEINRKRNWA